jgi:hypothetical protein
MIRGCLIAAPIAALMWLGIFGLGYGAMKYADFLDRKYMPPKCIGQTCYLTGPGGIVIFWTEHVKRNSGKHFIVKGLCASACEIAYRLAVTNGERVTVLPGARLQYHKPVRVP